TADFDAYPNTNINAFPKSETQTAIVMENADPDGLGRIRVQFAWQKITGEMTPWIRIVTPHAGGDKGFHFIPETGEEVLIGFEGGNAEHPYMMGSLYNGSGKAGAFQNANNDIKALQSRSGNKMVFNDNEGSTTNTDSGTAGIKLDGSGTIINQANDKFEIKIGDNSAIMIMDNEGNIIFEGKKQFQIIVGKSSIILNEDGNIVLNGKNILINGSESLDSRSNGSQILLNDNAKITGSKVDIN
ncbi:phage baseplate assembly protein V, partial [Olleya sp. AS48]|uniref:phage baseplate assembly protein V n=1 Tax=Olleya sp. AS48 TaxID=3135774 RepID=UPI003172F7EE